MRIKLFLLAAALVLSTSANATLIDYVMIGDIIVGNESGIENPYGLSAGDTITATGTINDDFLTGGYDYIGLTAGSGNTMTLTLGDYIMDLHVLSTIHVDEGVIVGADIFENLFVSSIDQFIHDEHEVMYGLWRPTDLYAVPEPAIVWLIGSGLLGLIGFARRKA